MRLTLRVAEAVRKAVHAELPVFVRISATDWVEGGWDADQSVEQCRRLKGLGSSARTPYPASRSRLWTCTGSR